jgi:hypothetical protein
MLIERQNGMTGRINVMYRTRQTVEYDMYPFIIAAKSAQNQQWEFYWKKTHSSSKNNGAKGRLFLVCFYSVISVKRIKR